MCIKRVEQENGAAPGFQQVELARHGVSAAALLLFDLNISRVKRKAMLKIKRAMGTKG